MTRARSQSALIALVGLALGLTACQTSPRIWVNAVTDKTGVFRCATGQAFIMENNDEQVAGYGASTEARRDSNCANEDTGPTWWHSLDVQASKYDGNRLCGISPRTTTTGRSVGVSDTVLCGLWPSDGIFTIGSHGATRPESGSTVRRELAFTPTVTTYQEPLMRKTNLLITAALASGVLGSAALASASSDTDQPAPRYDVEQLDRATDTQREVIEAIQADEPMPVVDQAGSERGFVRNSALSARDDRVTAKIVDGFREAKGGVDPEYNRIYEALRVLDPVPVVDKSGQTVGYFTSHFLSTDELEGRTSDAENTVAESLNR